MKRPLFLFLCSLLLTTTPVTAKTLSKVAAIVNDEIITTLQLDQAVIEDLSKNPQNQFNVTQFDQMKVQILDKLIDDKLSEQQTKRLGLQVSEEELNSAIADVESKNGLTHEALIQALATQGVTMPEYREKVKGEILHYKLLSREVNSKVLVTSIEVRNYFDQHIDEYTSGEKVSLNRISYDIPTGNEQQVAKLRKQAEACRDQLISGKDFDQVLADQGDSATGGDMGTLVESDLAKPLRAAIAGLNPGEVSEPLEINDQLYLFQVTGRSFDNDTLFEQVKNQIIEKLSQENRDIRFKEWRQELHDNAHIEVRI